MELPLVVQMRRELHKVPGIAWHEDFALGYIKDKLEKLDFPYRELTGGVVVDVTMVNDGSYRRLLRADCDALPIMEETGLEFASQVPGVMHACGHDGNTAMLLALLCAILAGEVVPATNLRLIFQRAEENPIVKSGGKWMVEEGALDGVAEAYALHLWDEKPVGIIQSRSGVMLVNSDRFRVKFIADGGHMARCNELVNVMDALADLNLALRQFRMPYGDQIRLAQTGSTADSAVGNVIPKWCQSWWGARNLFEPSDRKDFKTKIEAIVREVAERYGCQFEFEYIYGHPALFCGQATVDMAREVAEDVGCAWQEAEIVYGGEDFAYYAQRVPAAMVMVGSSQEGCGALHTSTFNPDERALEVGLEFWKSLVQRPLIG